MCDLCNKVCNEEKHATSKDHLRKLFTNELLVKIVAEQVSEGHSKLQPPYDTRPETPSEVCFNISIT